MRLDKAPRISVNASRRGLVRRGAALPGHVRHARHVLLRRGGPVEHSGQGPAESRWRGGRPLQVKAEMEKPWQPIVILRFLSHGDCVKCLCGADLVAVVLVVPVHARRARAHVHVPAPGELAHLLRKSSPGRTSPRGHHESAGKPRQLSLARPPGGKCREVLQPFPIAARVTPLVPSC